MQVHSLIQEDPLERQMATYSSILAWKFPWTEELCGLQSMGSQGVRYDLVTKHAHSHMHTHTPTHYEDSTIFMLRVQCNDSIFFVLQSDHSLINIHHHT